MEKWKDVENTNGKIQVSNYGRIRSLLKGSPYILKQSKDEKGYLRVKVTIDRKVYSFKVHRLVAKAFIPNDNNLPQVNHKDGDKSNNNYLNLEWISNYDNAHHAIENGLWTNVFDTLQKSNKSKMKAVIAVKGNERMRFESISDAEKYFQSRHITDVCKGKREHVKGWKLAYECEVMKL